ncbi:MBL fold metallo-hydrolase [Acuticoccus sediminis]|uniref:MBL fold metallo-hydrolase n=1 Tax=Acuticoccus sediminis TaxID=2184697 RepID=A0A8B2NFI1_9HYPH|nr:MBL fold metallo-hydrolase [Acuticoccus sediminis]RAH97758.1 MBL fold metallo-hydrolase [Acuticoccus sediminis]
MTATLTRIVDLDPFPLPASMLFPGRDLAELAPYRDVLAPDHVDFEAEAILLGVQSWLVRSAGLTVLVDTCVGEHKARPARADWHQRSATQYLANLAAAGVAPEEVDVVLCTHLHADHVGWNTRLVDGRWVPTFPNARYLIGRTELAHWAAVNGSNPAGAYADSVLPVVEAGLVDAVEDGYEIASGLTLMPHPGHTPGQVGLRFAGPHGPTVICGDAIHSPLQVYRPEWSSGFCVDPGLAIASRVALLEDAADRGTCLLPAHLRRWTGMRIRAEGDAFVPDFL